MSERVSYPAPASTLMQRVERRLFGWLDRRIDARITAAAQSRCPDPVVFPRAARDQVNAPTRSGLNALEVLARETRLMRPAPRPRFLSNTGLTLGDLACMLAMFVTVAVLIWLVVGEVRLIDLPPVHAPVHAPGGGTGGGR